LIDLWDWDDVCFFPDFWYDIRREFGLLKMMAIGSARIKANSLRIQFGILSGPVAFVFEAHRVCYKLHRVE
jgi:hypothetical protein